METKVESFTGSDEIQILETLAEKLNTVVEFGPIMDFTRQRDGYHFVFGFANNNLGCDVYENPDDAWGKINLIDSLECNSFDTREAILWALETLLNY